MRIVKVIILACCLNLFGCEGDSSDSELGLYCCALEKLCDLASDIVSHSDGNLEDIHLCFLDNESEIARAGDEKVCKRILDNNNMDVRIAFCSDNDDCTYTEPDALLQCEIEQREGSNYPTGGIAGYDHRISGGGVGGFAAISGGAYVPIAGDPLDPDSGDNSGGIGGETETRDSGTPTGSCGDGVVQQGEACDVGQIEGNMACVGCEVQRGWSCEGESSVCRLTGCLPPLGEYRAAGDSSPSTGTCILTVDWSGTADMSLFWNSEINPECEGTITISDDNCTRTWEGTCPLHGDVSGNAPETGTITQVSSDRIEGTTTVTHNRNNGESCTVHTDVTFTRLPSDNGEACWEDRHCTSTVCCPSDLGPTVPGTCVAVGECRRSNGSACFYDWQCESNLCTDMGNDVMTCTFCTPGQSHCEDQRVITCADDGLGYLADETDCAGSDQTCISGACHPIVCEANQRYCSDNDLYGCNATGTESSLLSACKLDEICKEENGTAQCIEEICLYTGDRECKSNTETAICSEDGTAWTEIDVCDEGVCVQGECFPVVCNANRRFCYQGNVELCNSSGTAHSLDSECTETQYCSEQGASATCEDQICTPTTESCQDHSVVVCNELGSEYVVTDECLLSDQACVDNQCHAMEVSEITGSSTNYGCLMSMYNSVMFGNVYYVEQDALTVEFFVNLYLDSDNSGNTAYFLIYQSESEDQDYQLVFERQETLPVGEGYYGSGPMQLSLVAGHYYYIAIKLDNILSPCLDESYAPALESTAFPVGTYIIDHMEVWETTVPGAPEVDMSSGSWSSLYLQRVYAVL